MDSAQAFPTVLSQSDHAQSAGPNSPEQLASIPLSTGGPASVGQNFLNEDFLQVLDEHRKNCEREGRVEEAN